MMSVIETEMDMRNRISISADEAMLQTFNRVWGHLLIVTGTLCKFSADAAPFGTENLCTHFRLM